MARFLLVGLPDGKKSLHHRVSKLGTRENPRCNKRSLTRGTATPGITVDAKGDWKIVQKNGEDYFEINNLKTKINVQESKLDIHPADGNKSGAQIAMDHMRGIIMPIVEEKAEEIMIQMGNQILGSAPLSEFLPA
ncbi:hypothetical protein C0J52_26470 [Blattella germanica]|nr:hypothetical protein C0J52_26470 [Blattella germanica]